METQKTLKQALLKGDMIEIQDVASTLPNLPPRLVPEGGSPFHVAAILGYEDCIASFLCKPDMDINLRDYALGWSPLMYSIANGHTEFTRLLLKSERRCNANVQDHYQQRPLHLEAQNQNTDTTISEWLLQNKAAINAQDAEGMTAFMRAVEGNNLMLAKFLHSKGCLINLSSVYGKTPLHLATRICCEKLVHWLVEIKCNINCVNNKFQTPLMICVQQRKPSHLIFKIMQYLLDGSTFINSQDYQGNTALLLAMGNPGTIKKHHIEMLLIAGSDPNIYNRAGLTAIWQAVCDGQQYPDRLRIIQMLLQENCYLDMSCRGKLLFTSGLDSVYCYENFMSPFEVAMDSGFYIAAKVLALAGCHVKSDTRYDTAVCDVPTELQWFQDLVGNPRPLLLCCRITIRRLLTGKKISASVRKLPIPERIKSYLLLDDVLN